MVVPGSVPATVRRRLIALLIDGVAGLVLGGGLLIAGLAAQWRSEGSLSNPSVSTVAGTSVLLVFAVVQWILLATSGRGVGGLLTAQRVVDQRTGGPIGLFRSALRCGVLLISAVLPLVGPVIVVASAAVDPSGRRRGWHDRVSRAMVLDLGVGIDPRNARLSGSQAEGRNGGLLGEDERRRLRPTRGVGDAEARGPLPPGPTQRTWSKAGRFTSTANRSPVGTGPASVAPSGVPRGQGTPVETATDEDLTEYDPWPTGEQPVSAYAGRAQSRTRTHATDSRREGAGMTSTGRVVPDAPYERVSSAPYRALEDEVEQTQLREARSRVAYAPTKAQTRPRATLLLWDNRVVVLDGTALVGRNPSPREGESLPVQVIAVLDRGRSVSKTHLAMGVDADGVWLKDRSSTNGTIVTLTDGQQILCAPEQSVRVPIGASIAFGDYWLTVAG